MSSGFGINGGKGRCFPFWQEFAKCHMQADTPEECALPLEDYKECLFHKKEVCFINVNCANFRQIARLKMVQEEYENQLKAKK